jgi:hypothetical protein
MNELGPEARQILEGGRAGDEPTGEDRRRMRASVMRAIAAGGAIGAASAAAETSAAAGLKVGAVSAWKVAAGLFLAGAVAGAGAGAIGSRDDAPRPSTTAVASVRAAPVVPARRPQEPLASPPGEAPAPAPAPSAAVPQPAPGPAPAAPRSSAAPPSPPEDTLPAENQGLREAYGAMQGGDPARALALLDEQQAKGSALREEREAARVLALCQLGRVDEGRAAAARFLQASPRSPLADRVRNACPAREMR